MSKISETGGEGLQTPFPAPPPQAHTPMFEALQTETYLRYTFYFPEAHDLSELYYKVRQQLLQSTTVSYHKIRQPFITICDM